MEIKVSIEGGVKEYIDVEDLQASINLEVRQLVVQAIKNVVRDDYRLTGMVHRAVVDKVSSAILPTQFEDLIAEKMEREIRDASSTTIQYSWGVSEKAKELLKSRADEILEVLTPRLDAAIASAEFNECEVKSLVRDIILQRVKDSGLHLKVEKIVDDYIEGSLYDYLDYREESHAKA